MYISVTKIVFKLSTIALRMSKIGRNLVKIVSHASLYVNICHGDCTELSTIACQLRKIGHELAKIVFLYEHL